MLARTRVQAVVRAPDSEACQWRCLLSTLQAQHAKHGSATQVTLSYGHAWRRTSETTRPLPPSASSTANVQARAEQVLVEGRHDVRGHHRPCAAQHD